MPLDISELGRIQVEEHLREKDYESAIELVLSEFPQSTRDEAVDIVNEIEEEMK